MGRGEDRTPLLLTGRKKSSKFRTPPTPRWTGSSLRVPPLSVGHDRPYPHPTEPQVDRNLNSLSRSRKGRHITPLPIPNPLFSVVPPESPSTPSQQGPTPKTYRTSPEPRMCPVTGVVTSVSLIGPFFRVYLRPHNPLIDSVRLGRSGM